MALMDGHAQSCSHVSVSKWRLVAGGIPQEPVVGLVCIAVCGDRMKGNDFKLEGWI